jgi:hypothetical protein
VPDPMLAFPTSNALISDSLAPAVAISGAALMTMGLLNRLSHLGNRVRQLNQSLRETDDPYRLNNLNRQIAMVIARAGMVRNALILLYSAIGCMVLTAFGLALTALHVLPEAAHVPINTFLLGLFAVLLAVVVEMFEVTLALRALKLDIEAYQLL